MRRARNGQVFRGLALGGAFPRPSGYIGCSCMSGAEPRPYGVIWLSCGDGDSYIRRGDPAPIGVRLVLLYGAEQSPAPTGDLVIPRRRGFPVYIRRSVPTPIGVRLAFP